MKKTFLFTAITLTLLGSCVSKKKYVGSQNELFKTQVELSDVRTEKENLASENQILKEKFDQIESRVEEYNAKINSLKASNDEKYSLEGKTLISNKQREKLLSTLSNVPQEDLANARSLEDSINVAISYNLKKSISQSPDQSSDDIKIDIDKTVVMISVSDRLLFNTGSYVVSQKAYPLLQRLAEVINFEPSMEVMIEGHTDPRSFQTESLRDNWDLSVKRATSIVRLLQHQYKVAPEKMIAAGRSSYVPLVENDTKENMAKNRRTRIVIIPDLDKFFALM
jgi:chemotaxis protein MotB